MMRTAAAFLVKRQGRDGTWRDFRTLAGQSEDWTTAYVGCQIASAHAPASSLRRAVQALVARQRQNGGWGYNTSVPADGDSTAWALLFLAPLTRRGPALKAAARCLLAHQDPYTGGFATYADAPAILGYMRLPLSVSPAGWRLPLVEVTAVAARALARLSGAPSSAIRTAWRFVQDRQDDEGRWMSYWWSTPLYATLQAVTFASSRPVRSGAREALLRAVRWVIRKQRADGGWAAGSDSTARAFDTALALAIVSLGPPSRESREVLTRGICCLEEMQMASGAWPSAPMLRIPPPGISNPDRYRQWRIEELGTGVTISDRDQLFTTATVISALTSVHRTLIASI